MASRTTPDPKPDISIVVCTFNRAGMLAEALASLADLTTDGAFTYEIVVIDNASTDETQAVIAAAAGRCKYSLRGILETQKGIIPARNRGIREARGQWIAFFDDDQLADPRWLAELYRGAREQKCRVVGGAVHLALPPREVGRLSSTVRMLLGESILSQKPLRYGGRITPGCGNLMVARTVFDEVGVFQLTIEGRGEDTDLFMRIDAAGIEAWYLPAAIIHHMTPPERLTPAYLKNLARRMGQGIAQRQAERLGPRRFAVLWLAKGLRMAFTQYGLCAVARLAAHREAALGWQCKIAISQGFLIRGWRLLWSAVRPQQRTDAGSVKASIPAQT